MARLRAGHSKLRTAVGSQIPVFVSDRGPRHERRLSDLRYESNPWARHSLETGKGAYGVGAAGANIPNNVLIEPVEQIEETANGPKRVVKWIGNGGRWGPCETIDELELQIYGSRRSWI
jgi:hypothetical protein